MKRALAVGAILAFALAIACQVPDRHFQLRDGGIDSPDAAIDAMPDADLGPCDLTGAWSAPVAVGGLSQLLSIARFTGDELTAYFALGSDGGTTPPDTLYVAQRAGLGAPFGTPIKLTGVNGSDGMTTPTISPDGMALFYTWELPIHTNGSDRDIYKATRIGSDVSMFTAGSRVVFSNVGDPEDYPYVGSNGDVWFSSQRGSETNLQIYEAPSAGGNAFGTVVEEPVVNSPTNTNIDPAITWDRHGLYFQRAGIVYYATRAGITGAFDTPMKVNELNNGSATGYCGGKYCRPAWISPDGCRLYIGIGPANMPIDMYMLSKPANP